MEPESDKKRQDQCGNKLELADDFGDNPCTFCCVLLKGHSGNHVESFGRPTEKPVSVIWIDNTK